MEGNWGKKKNLSALSMITWLKNGNILMPSSILITTIMSESKNKKDIWRNNDWKLPKFIEKH